LKPSNNFTYWDQKRGKINSKKGGWKIGHGVFNHGYSMMDDLAGEVSYMQVMMLNVTGRLPERRLADWIEALHICLSWPDPRIWCNQIGALSGVAKTSVVAATSAGNLAMDSRAYGAKTLLDGMGFIQMALKKYKQGISVDEIVKSASQRVGAKPVITGYARPIAKGDERVGAMERVTKKLNYEVGEHMTLAYKIENHLYEHFSESMNINGYVSAFMSDQGYTAEESYRVCAILVTSGVTACYVDTYDNSHGVFLPLRCDDIAYKGKPYRALP